ncbi:hypothetical protein ABFS83_01G040700 [Erythranthe nasuta]
MERCPGKRVTAGGGTIMSPKKAYSVAYKGTSNEGDQNTQFCNRIGCSGRIKCSQNPRFGSSDCNSRTKCNANPRIGISDNNKAKYAKPTFSSSNGSEANRNSTRVTPVSTAGAKKSNLDSKRKMPSQSKPDPSESSSLSSESESVKKSEEGLNTSEYGSSSVSSSNNNRPRKIFQHKYGLLKNQNTPHSPSSSLPSTSRSSPQGPFNKGKYGIRNLKCNSISDVVRPNSEVGPAGKNSMKRRSVEGESSLSSRWRNNSGISISDSTSANARTRLSQHRQNGRNAGNEIAFSGGGNSLRQFSASGPRHSSNSSGSGNNSSTSDETGFAQLMSHRYNMDGIAEVLLALERIEQDEELTHEQVLALETSLFLSGLNLYDQHRDMRLDIDNMSYEDLLALEEKMGTVSTALPEDALSKCIRRSVYKVVGPPKVQITESDEDDNDIKCSICQEEYVVGDEIGNLVECQHGFHEKCVNHWLQMKNWCPICKSSVAPSKVLSS